MAVHDKVWPWTLGNTVRLTFAWWKMAPCIRSALTCMMLTFCIWYYPRVLRETGAKTRETGAKRRETGAKKKSVPLDPLVLTVMTCRVFLKTLFTHGPNRRHGPKRRRRHVVLSLWGACCFSLSLASSSIAPFSSWNGFISVLLGLPVRMFWILPRVVFILYLLCICLLWMWCFCVECWTPCMRILRVKKKCPTVDVVLWKLRYSWRLLAGSILAILGLWKTYVMLRWIL